MWIIKGFVQVGKGGKKNDGVIDKYRGYGRAFD